ncbi:disease susceptibility protein LOV1-like [Corylus avellana]|uniref:disease susceptibility protein LOV1-like n=1 Tax=Corylus avellana TaxID=13451 RepID=UPI00286AFFCA|nr:disease susceptibility protein LOV1-like [Corylus avellana]XP_059446485.1 disease susceptibility protein LOV1-like [Corylus avellana]
MADNVVNVLLQQLPLLIQGASFLSEVEDEVKSFQRELERINIFLENSNKFAYEAEDVIDTFILKVEEQRKRNIAGKIVYGIMHAKMLRDVAKKIEGLNKEIKKIYDNIEKYEIEKDEISVDTETEKAMHRRRRYVEEDEVVGFVNDSYTLANQLTYETENSNLDVISIVGMGGLGKTTLARKIYNNDHMPISDELTTKLKGMSEEHAKVFLVEKLHKCLQGKRYLVVMDDIWKTQDWNEVKDAFPITPMEAEY